MENFHFKLFSLSELMYRVKFLNLLRAKNDDKKKLCNSNEGCKLLKLHIYIYIYYIERKMLSDSMLYLSAACSIFSEWLKILFFFCFSALCAPFLLSSHGYLCLGRFWRNLYIVTDLPEEERKCWLLPGPQILSFWNTVFPVSVIWY